MLDAGLPDVIVVPDLDTLLPDSVGARRGVVHRRRGEPRGQRPVDESPRQVLRRALEIFDTTGSPGGRARVGIFSLRAGRRSPNGWRPYCDEPPGNVYATGRRGDSDGHLLRTLRTLSSAGLQTHRRQPRVRGRAVRNQPRPFVRDGRGRSRVAGLQDRASRNSPEGRAGSRRSWPSRSTTAAAAGSTCTSRAARRTGATRSRRLGTSHGLSDEARWAIGGILKHAPALAALLDPDGELVQAVRAGLARAVADRLGSRQPQLDAAGAGRAGRDDAAGAAARRREREPVPRRSPVCSRPPTWALVDRIEPPRPSARVRVRPVEGAHAARHAARRARLSGEDTSMVEVLGEDFVRSYVDFKWEEVAQLPAVRDRLGVHRVRVPPIVHLR